MILAACVCSSSADDGHDVAQAGVSSPTLAANYIRVHIRLSVSLCSHREVSILMQHGVDVKRPPYYADAPGQPQAKK